MEMKVELQTLKMKGKIPRQQYIPVFEDILQYLDYLSLDEPIIGLSFLFEIPDSELPGIKYSCTLCNVHAYLTEAVQHVIGRKHRQKYLERKRPDLINWDDQRHQSIPGKTMRAKAEIAERQDGRGMPKLLPDKAKRHLLERSSIQGGPNNGQGSSFAQDMGQSTPKLGNYSKNPGRQMSDDYIQERYDDTFANRTPFAEHYKQDNRLDYSDFDSKGCDDFSNVARHHDQDRRKYDCSSREELYTDAFRNPPVQKDVLKEFYTEELRREQLAKAQNWPNDIDSYQYEQTKRPREVGGGPNQSNYSTSLDGKNLHEIYNPTKDYRHGFVERHETSNLGPRRVSPSKPGDFSRKISNIPDPFMRFLKGDSSHEEPLGKKRKSRFSDATAEELQTAHEMLADEYGPPDRKFPSLRSEFRDLKAKRADNPIGLKQTQTYQEELLPQSSESTGNVFEMLKNIEIENEEEATFLKERLCSVLREFKAMKAEKAAQTRPSRVVTVNEYSNMRPVTQQHTQDRYGRPPRENLGLKRAEEPYNDPTQESYNEQMLDLGSRKAVEPYDGPGQESYTEQMLGEHFKEHKQSVFPEGRYSTRKPYNELKRWPSKNQPQHAPDFDVPPPFPETLHEPLRPRDYQSADNFTDYQTSTSHLPVERGPRMNRTPQYSRNLDKITSTLLELVKRK